MTLKNKSSLIIALNLLLYGMSVNADDIPVIDCMIEPNVMVDLSSPVSGVLDTLTVDKSDEIKKGQLIATLKSEVEEVNVQTSVERLRLSGIEHQRVVELYRERKQFHRVIKINLKMRKGYMS